MSKVPCTRWGEQFFFDVFSDFLENL